MKHLMMQKAVAVGICCAMITSGSVLGMSRIALAKEVSRSTGIQVNGEQMQLDVNPFIENDRTYIPLRGVMEKLGAQVEWQPEGETVIVDAGYIRLELRIGKDTVKVTRIQEGIPKEENIKLDVPAKIVSGRAFIPGRFVAEAVGATVEWDRVSNTMRIESKEKDHMITIERPISFEIVDHKTVEKSTALAKWYENNRQTKGMYHLADGEWMYVLVSAGEKPTGGYGVKIDSITEVAPGSAYVSATQSSPGADSFVTQALTYPNAIVRFPKEGIKQVQGDLVDAQLGVDPAIREDIGESLHEMGKPISLDSIQEMKLYSLMGEERKTFTRDEIKELVEHLNTSPTYNGAYIAMLAGNNIQITVENGKSMQLTSFGSKDHVILSGDVGGEYRTYCIVSPEVGRILLDQTGSME